MINSMHIYTLKGCDKCDNLKKNLRDAKIMFINVDCSGNNFNCDKLESNTGCDMYPMVAIKTSENRNIIICLAKESSQLQNPQILPDSSFAIFTHSINTMLDIIKKI